MPKSKPAISDEVLLKDLDKLSPSILITPEQLSLILARTPGQLAEDRAAGNPPPFVKIGGSNRYRIGDVLALAKHTHKNTAEASKYARERVAGLRYSSFTTFLNDGAIDDEWPFAIVQGRPVDFLSSLTMQLSDDDRCEWLSLGAYLTLRKQSAEAQVSLEQLAELERNEPVAERLLETPSGKPPLL